MLDQIPATVVLAMGRMVVVTGDFDLSFPGSIGLCSAGAVKMTRNAEAGAAVAVWLGLGSLRRRRTPPDVCQVQRYGLAAVTGHLVATGEILGKGTDGLEGYDWPLDASGMDRAASPRSTAPRCSRRGAGTTSRNRR